MVIENIPGSGDRAREVVDQALERARRELEDLMARQKNGEEVLDEIRKKIQEMREYGQDLGRIDAADYKNP